MNVVSKLTLRHLRENKGRTVITTLGICISVAMITAVFVAAASMINLFAEMAVIEGGRQNAVLCVDQAQLKELEDDDRIAKVGVRVYFDDNCYGVNSVSKGKTLTGEIYTGDYENLNQMFLGEYDGDLPENENEIIVENKFIKNNQLNWDIGDVVEIPIGSIVENDDGSQLYGNGKFVSSGKEKFKITAIAYDNPATASHYSIARGFNRDNLSSSNENIDAYIELKEVNHKSLQTINDIISEYKVESYEINSLYLETKFAVDKDSLIISTIMPIALTTLVIIMIASVFLIYNAFGMSLSERVRYLGMLASVGATKKQKRASVYYEGLILGAVGIPVGIIAGIIGIAITIKAVGNKIISSGMILGVTSSTIQADVVVPAVAIIAIVIFSVITILISSFIPARRASKISPIDAISQRKEIKLKAKKLKSPKIIRLIFGYEGELAYKNLKRNGGKSRIITASIALSLVLFISCNYFCSLFSEAINLEKSPYQVQASVKYSDMDSFKKSLGNISKIDKYYINNNRFTIVSQNEDNANSSMLNGGYFKGEYKKIAEKSLPVYLNLIEDEDFNNLCRDNDIDYRDYYNGTSKVLIMDNIKHGKFKNGVFDESILGFKINVDESEYIVSDFVDYDNDNYCCKLNPQNSASLYIPFSEYVNNPSVDKDSFMTLFGIETQYHSDVVEEIFALADETTGFGEFFSVNDIVETIQMMETIVFVFSVFIYGFISLITLITVANIINTVSTGIASRRKEFAMFKSIGITPKGFRKMIALESAFYGIKAVLFGVPLSILVSYIMYSMIAATRVFSFAVDLKFYLVAIVALFIIIGCTMIYSVSKIKNNSIVSTLKEEIN